MFPTRTSGSSSTRRLASAEEEAALYDLADELRDRYGEIPGPAALLLEVMKLRVLMKRLEVESAEYDGRQLIFGFHPATSVPPEKILRLVAEPGERYRFSPDYRLSVRLGRLHGARPFWQRPKKNCRRFFSYGSLESRSRLVFWSRAAGRRTCGGKF